MTFAFIVILAVLLFIYLAVPLILPPQRGSLPDLRDPVTQDLEEERDALLRAIRELEARDDLAQARREELRARYEAKTAKVLRALDERQAASAPVKPRKPLRGLPLAAMGLLAVGLGSAAFMANRAAPEVIASEDGSAPSITGEEIGRLERRAERDPSETNLLALGDGYWRAQNANQAQEVYSRVVDTVKPVPAVAYSRLGLLALRSDVPTALRYLELARSADPNDLETLYFLGEIYYANEDMAAATEVWQSYLNAPGGEGDTEVEARLELAQTLQPLLAAVEEDPNEANLLRVANVLWTRQERGRAVEYYFQVLTEKNPHSAVALSRVGQQLFFSGRNQEAITILNRARNIAPDNLQTLLFLGNAHFTLGQYRKAIGVWQDYVEVAGGPGKAGRVPSLIADARERLRTGAPPVSQDPAGQPTSQDPASQQRTPPDTVQVAPQATLPTSSP